MTPTAIICSDLHLREDTPVCRTDDYWLATVTKLGFIRELQEEHKCPLLCAGDIFHHWKPSPWLISQAMEQLRLGMIAIPGQHDLPNHNMDLFPKSGLHALQTAGVVNALSGGTKCCSGPSSSVYGYEYGHDNPQLTGRTKGSARKVAMIHTLSYRKKPEWEDMQADSASAILKRMKDFDLIICGDNHKSFMVTDDDGRMFLSPGALMRMSADEEDREPCVWLYYDEDNTLERVNLPIEEGVISRAHVEKKESRDERVEAFVERLKGGYEAGLNFSDNLEAHFKKNKTKKAVKDLVWECVG